jgi:hypothetical protein
MIFDKKGTAVHKTFVIILAVVACFLAGSSRISAATQWNVGISGDNHGIDGFDFSVGEYYHVPEREVVVVHERGIPKEELPVVFFIAERAHVRPEAVVVLRNRGMSWMDITLHFGLSPEIYYVPVRSGHPHGNAYGYYRNHHREDWKRMHFRDADIVNQVNLKFMSEHHGYAPEKIMKERSGGKSFTRIDQDISRARHDQAGHGKPVQVVKNGPTEKGKGKYRD